MAGLAARLKPLLTGQHERVTVIDRVVGVDLRVRMAFVTLFVGSRREAHEAVVGRRVSRPVASATVDCRELAAAAIRDR